MQLAPAQHCQSLTVDLPWRPLGHLPVSLTLTRADLGLCCRRRLPSLPGHVLVALFAFAFAAQSAERLLDDP